MTMPRSNAVPRVPTPPRGEEVASYATYLEAQQAVDYLSDHRFAVELVTIVGTDLRMVERVTGRLTSSRVAIAGLASGAWFGLFVGLLLFMFSGQPGALFIGVGLGAGFGLLFSMLSYSLTSRGRRDFTSSSQIVASSYALLCAHEAAGDARRLLTQMPGGADRVHSAGATPTWTTTPSAPQPTAPVAPPAPAPRPTPDPRWTTPTGEPRYGAMRPTPEATPAPAPPVEKSDDPSGQESHPS